MHSPNSGRYGPGAAASKLGQKLAAAMRCITPAAGEAMGQQHSRALHEEQHSRALHEQQHSRV
jgi:hypothetical protein